MNLAGTDVADHDRDRGEEHDEERLPRRAPVGLHLLVRGYLELRGPHHPPEQRSHDGPSLGFTG